MKKITTVLALTAFLSALPLTAKAVTFDMTEIETLDFGTFGFKGGGNISGRWIRVFPNNSYTTHADVVVDPLNPPQRAHYELSGGLPVSTQLIITFSQASISLTGGGDSMTVNNFESNNPSTDGAGNATLYFGATMTTDGDSSSRSYSGTVDIVIDY